MTQQVIDIGSAPDDGTGDPLRLSFDKTNENFTELYAKGAAEGLWNFNQTSSDTSTAPVSGRFKTNSGNYRTATQIAIHGITIQGIDRSSTLRTLLVGDLIQCQDKSNAAAWCRYSLQSLPVDHGTWFQLNVTFQADGGVASGDNQEIVFVFTAGSGGGGGGGGAGSAEYTFSTNISAPPSSGQIRFNNAAVASATIVWINNHTSGGTDLKRYFETLSIGTKLYIQDESDSSQYAKYQVASAPVDQTTYWEFPVTYLASGGALVNQQRVALIVQLPPAAAAGAPVGAEYITSSADATLTAERVLTNTATITWDFSTPGQAKASTTGGGGQLVVPQGRLTLQTLTPVMITTQSAKTTIYFSPYVGNTVPIYNGTSFTMTTFAELSIATTDTTKSPAAIGASKCNDWFVWSDAGTMRVGHGPDWTNDTTRSAGTALVMVNGILLNNANITNGPAASRGTYVGTTRSNASSQLDWIFGGISGGGAAGFFGVWNCYNRRSVISFVGDTGASWTCTGAIWRAPNTNTTMRTSFVIGLQEDPITAEYHAIANINGSDASIAIGFDSTTLPSGVICYVYSATLIYQDPTCKYGTIPPIGFHYVSALEKVVSGTSSFIGNVSDYMQSGLTTSLFM